MDLFGAISAIDIILLIPLIADQRIQIKISKKQKQIILAADSIEKATSPLVESSKKKTKKLKSSPEKEKERQY